MDRIAGYIEGLDALVARALDILVVTMAGLLLLLLNWAVFARLCCS